MEEGRSTAASNGCDGPEGKKWRILGFLETSMQNSIATFAVNTGGKCTEIEDQGVIQHKGSTGLT